MNDVYTWSDDMYPIVKKRFDERYNSRVNLIGSVAGIVKQSDLTYNIEGLGGYGELPEYASSSLTRASGTKGFINTVTPTERALALPVEYKNAKLDIVGEAEKVGRRLADSAYMTVLSAFYRMFGKVSAELPSDFAAFCYVRAGRVYFGRENFEIVSGRLRSDVIGAGAHELVYVAFPAEINTETDENTDLCLDAYVCDTVCYGAAMELCTNIYPTDVQRYMRLATEYDERLANLLTAASDGARVTNGFFTGARGVFI